MQATTGYLSTRKESTRYLALTNIRYGLHKLDLITPFFSTGSRQLQIRIGYATNLLRKIHRLSNEDSWSRKDFHESQKVADSTDDVEKFGCDLSYGPSAQYTEQRYGYNENEDSAELSQLVAQHVIDF